MFGPITAEPCRAKAHPLRPRRSCFTPIRCRFSCERNVVEVPGTAPGSDGFITMAVYRHSHLAGGSYLYNRSACEFEEAGITLPTAATANPQLPILGPCGNILSSCVTSAIAAPGRATGPAPAR